LRATLSVIIFVTLDRGQGTKRNDSSVFAHDKTTVNLKPISNAAV